MAVMTATSSVEFPLPARPFSYADLELMPDDGRRYEIIDGILIVSPSPVTVHQRVSSNVLGILRAAAPPPFEVFGAPFDVVRADDAVLEPDLLVAAESDLTRKNLPKAPALAVVILSPSTRRVDLTLKLARLEEARCDAYWVVDPDTPSVRIWELAGDCYGEPRVLTRDGVVEVERPFAVTFAVTELIKPSRRP